MRFRSFSMAAVLLFVMGCSLFDSGMPWESGPYALLWIDLPDEVQLSYDLGRGSWATLVGPRVFAVGANQEYVVAQQHPGGDKTIANFFIIEVQAGAKATSQHGIIGPLGEQEVYEKAATLRLPAFTKNIGVFAVSLPNRGLQPPVGAPSSGALRPSGRLRAACG